MSIQSEDGYYSCFPMIQVFMAVFLTLEQVARTGLNIKDWVTNSAQSYISKRGGEELV